MNGAIRRIALGIGLAFTALIVNLNVVQLGKSTELSEHPQNRRLLVREYATRRGEMLVGDRVIARSIEGDNPTYTYSREYPYKTLYGPITGYYSFYYGAAGLERTFNDILLGKEPASTTTLVDDLLGRQHAGNIVRLTLDHGLQKAARDALGGQRGAVAAVDPETGAVLALYASPMYDPNPLSIDPREEGAIRAAWSDLNADPSRPLTFKATSQRYPPGSTFKIVTAAAGLQSGMTPSTSFANPARLNLPDTNLTLRNFGGGRCPGGGGSISMAAGFRVSCNTTFAQVAMRIGQDKLKDMASSFGLEAPPPFDIGAVASCVRAIAGSGCSDEPISRPGTAYSGIGQQDVRVTPLQMALVAATVGNGGRLPRPYLVEAVLAPDGGIIEETAPQLTRRIYKKRVATQLKKMMIDTVRFGTGAVVGFRDAGKGIVGGKTGTAQTGIEGQAPHVWFVAFSPDIAVAVVVENGGDLGDSATGGRVAGPIAKALIDRVSRQKGSR